MASDPVWPVIQPALERVAARRLSQNRLGSSARRMVRAVWPLPPGVYVFAYHTIVDPQNLQTWERAFEKGWVSVAHFERHVAFLSQRMTPVPLSTMPEFIAGRPVDRAYFAITFDDGYANLLSHAAPVAARYGIRPTVFVNGRFAEGAVYYRVLAALLTKGGHSRELAGELRRQDPRVTWSDEPLVLFNQTKNFYRSPGLLEEATESVYRRCLGTPSDLKVHMGPEEVKTLQQAGWEIGNHTYAHAPLGALNEQDTVQAIESNETYWAKKGIPLIDAVAYPNGAARDVNRFVAKYLDAHPRIQGFFCNGGVNFRPLRTECLRMFAGNGSIRLLKQRVHEEIARTRLAMTSVRLT
jgi:peptidoglycan/xylan/chitin deacetylase (PgdA/CDA1 family)